MRIERESNNQAALPLCISILWICVLVHTNIASQHSINSAGFSTFANNSIGFATFSQISEMERICCVAITLRACLSFYLSCNDRFLFTCAKDSSHFFFHPFDVRSFFIRFWIKNVSLLFAVCVYSLFFSIFSFFNPYVRNPT